MHIYFDLDETMIDDEGQALRPGILPLLQNLADDGHRLSLWSASTEERGEEMLTLHDLQETFDVRVYREDYDPCCEGHPKDIRYCDGDLLIDDNPSHIEFVRSIGKNGIAIRPFDKRTKNDWTDDCNVIYDAIHRMIDPS